MFDITGSQIAQLNDTDLRTLVARLCETELHRIGLPVSAVTSGGHQNAPDGGIDVRVDLPLSTPIQGFVPRPTTGFQVKVPDMPRSAIVSEMCPHGAVRHMIAELANQSGAYIIVSATGSTADEVLQERKRAMRDAIASLPNASALVLDFYDRERLASWVRQYPGMVAWVRETIGQPIQGWQTYANWASPNEGLEAEYLGDGTNRLQDWHSQQQGPLTVVEGIQRIRAVLASPTGVIRLVGLSGTGKTRLVQALFDQRVGDGEHALDPALAVYTDLAEQPEPDPRVLMRQLVQERRRAIVIIDNCPPETHRALTAICTGPQSPLSLITVEYDVGEDEPEDTNVFRLESASDEVIEHLLERRVPHISQVDGRRIAEFSGGNARIALALARTVERGDSVGNLTDRMLFERLFYQRNVPDDSLLRAAQVCSLVYSFDGEQLEGERAELPLLAGLAGLSIDEVYRQAGVLRSRDLLQKRGQWRAVLPHAVANRLARQALDRISPARVVAVFQTHERLLQSFSRRLGYLHDSDPARTIVQGWLAPRGLLSEVRQLSSVGVAMFHNVAPVDPDAALNAIEHTANSLDGNTFFSLENNARDTWISLLRLLAYEAALFPRAVALLLRFALAENHERNNRSAHNAFKQLFFIHLSGTHASLEQRLQVVDSLTSSEEPTRQALGLAALDSLLESWHFTGHGFEFGARTRDYGWWPTSRDEVVNWYGTTVNYAQRLALSTSPLAKKARTMLAENFRSLWSNIGMVDQLETMASAVSGQSFWPEGWIAVKQTIRFDSDKLPAEIASRLHTLERNLRPVSLLERARAYLLSNVPSTLDIADGEAAEEGEDDISPFRRVEEATEMLGYEIANNNEVLEVLLPELVSDEVILRVICLGKGLAAGTSNLAMMWQRLVRAFAVAPEQKRYLALLHGYIRGAAERDEAAMVVFLDDAIHDPVLGPYFPSLQTAAAIGEVGATRLEAALAASLAPAPAYRSLIYGRVTDSIPSTGLRRIVPAIASLLDGYKIAIDVLAARLHAVKVSEETVDDEIVQCGRELIRHWSAGREDHDLDHDLAEIVRVCLSEPDSEPEIAQVCRQLFGKLRDYEVYISDYPHLLSCLFRQHPSVVLDEFFGDGVEEEMLFHRWRDYLVHGNPLDDVPLEALIAWAQVEPSTRYARLAAVITPFTDNDGTTAPVWTSTALELVRLAPDRLAVLTNLSLPLVPNSWMGSRADLVERRRMLLQAFISDAAPEVASWVRQRDTELEQVVQRERLRERRVDASFE
jgi:hypothetical protein